jgi:hypothetical protein
MFKLAVEDTVEVPVKFTLRDKGVDKLFSFNVTATRLPQEDINTRLDEKDRKVSDLMRELVTGWKGQRLVLNADDSPAEFSQEALDAMLGVAGVGATIFGAYFKAVGAKEKN